MNHILKSFIFLIACLGCNPSETTSEKKLAKTIVKSNQIDTFILKEAFIEDDIIVNEFEIERLKPIRKNFKRINSITKWTLIKKDLWETNEGGEASYYYSKGVLEKVITREFGETFQLLTEYYLLKGQLSFVLEKTYKYNRPIYWDSVAMRENQDDESFDFEKSEIIEDRSYFEDGNLIHQIGQDFGAPFSKDYLLAKQKRIKDYFDFLIKDKT